MNKDIKLILIIVITLGLMFATSLLLELDLVQKQIIRQIIIYIAIMLQLFIGFVVFKVNLK